METFSVELQYMAEHYIIYNKLGLHQLLTRESEPALLPEITAECMSFAIVSLHH